MIAPTPLVQLAEHPADGLVDQVVIVVHEELRDREGVARIAGSQRVEGGDRRDAPLPDELRTRELRERLAALAAQLGAGPAISSSGVASATSANPFLVDASDVLNQKFGLLFYGTTQAALAFQGGTLCMTLPVTRTNVQTSGGSASGTDCTGSYSFDVNAWIQGGSDPSLVAGVQMCCQYWMRDPQDPTGFATSLSNALEVTIAP